MNNSQQFVCGATVPWTFNEMLQTFSVDYDAELQQDQCGGQLASPINKNPASPPWTSGEARSDFSLLSSNPSANSLQDDASPEFPPEEAPAPPVDAENITIMTNNITFKVQLPESSGEPSEGPEGSENNNLVSDGPTAKPQILSPGVSNPPEGQETEENEATDQTSGVQESSADPPAEAPSSVSQEAAVDAQVEASVEGPGDQCANLLLTEEEGAVGGVAQEDHAYDDIDDDKEGPMYTDTDPTALDQPPNKTAPAAPDKRSLIPDHLKGKVTEDELEKRLKQAVAKDLQQLRGQHHHGPAYDFTLGEVNDAFKGMEGWQAHLQEKDMPSRLSPSRLGPGHYILWFWAKRKRPAICVINNGKLKTFTLHKVPAKHSSTKKTYFYLYKSQHKDKSLKGLVEHHIKHGFYEENNTSEERIFVKLEKPVQS